MTELADQSIAIFNNAKFEIKKFPHRIAFNCIPQIGPFLANGYTEEEMKMVNETRKMFHDDTIRVAATTVRVPVFACHSEAVNVEFENPISPDQAREILSRSPGVVVMDDPEQSFYPLPTEAIDTDQTYVGRIRNDISVDNGLTLWCVADNLRKGAATNAVQIAEVLIEKYI